MVYLAVSNDGCVMMGELGSYERKVGRNNFENDTIAQCAPFEKREKSFFLSLAHSQSQKVGGSVLTGWCVASCFCTLSQDIYSTLLPCTQANKWELVKL